MIPTLKFEFKGLVWRILFAVDTPFFLVETRNSETRTASFYVIDLSKKEIVISDLELTEKWWIGVESIKNGCIYFHFYDGVQYSNHKGIVCYDISSKKTIWETKNIAFVGWQNDSIIGLEKGILHQINAISGEIVAKNSNYTIENQHPSDIQLLDQEDERFLKVASYIYRKTTHQAVKHIEYLDYKSYILISYYICVDNKFDNHFMLVDSETGFILFETILDVQSAGIGSDTFSVFNNYLILCQNKKNIHLYAL